MDDKTLVERLQEREHHFRHASEGEYDANLFMKARFEIEAQAEENKALQVRVEALEARWTMIDKLRAAEGHSVTIIHDNPDFGGPNCVIHVSTSYGQDWEAYYGDTVDDCLRKAVEALEGKSNG